MVEATVGRGEKTSVERRYFLSSLPLTAGPLQEPAGQRRRSAAREEVDDVMPIQVHHDGSRTTLNIEVRRFYCSNPCCCRRTFAEPASDLVAPWARRTRQLAETQGRVGIVCGGAPGARLLTHLRMPASRATVLRLVRAMPMPNAPAPTHVGVDDWAMRKSCSYGKAAGWNHEYLRAIVTQTA